MIRIRAKLGLPLRHARARCSHGGGAKWVEFRPRLVVTDYRKDSGMPAAMHGGRGVIPGRLFVPADLFHEGAAIEPHPMSPALVAWL